MAKKKPIRAKHAVTSATEGYNDVVNGITLTLSNYMYDIDKCQSIAEMLVKKIPSDTFEQRYACTTPTIFARSIICDNLDYISGQISTDSVPENNKTRPSAVDNARRMMFEAYSKFDFVDLTNMLNYRGTHIVPSVQSENEQDSIEEMYIHSEPGTYQVMELQAYVYAILQDALTRFAAQAAEYPDADGIFSEYYNMAAGIFCRIDKASCEISYQPIRTITYS